MSEVTMDRGAEFRVGNVLTRAGEIFGPNFLFFFLTTLVVSLPNLLFLSRDPGLPGYFTMLWIAVLAVMVINAIAQAIILFASFQQLRGQPVQMAEAFQRALARFLPLVGLGFLYALGIMVGFMLLFVPGIILGVMWAAAVPVCVVEGLGPVASFSRSSALTKGHRWKIFWILVLLTVVSLIVNKIVVLVLSPVGLGAMAIGSVILTAVWAAYWNCVLIMIYHDLRVAKEGIDTAQIAAVFD